MKKGACFQLTLFLDSSMADSNALSFSFFRNPCRKGEKELQSKKKKKSALQYHQIHIVVLSSFNAEKCSQLSPQSTPEKFKGHFTSPEVR